MKRIEHDGRTVFGYSSRSTWAEFSDCLHYRYTLGRRWSDGPIAAFLLLNPSTADDIDNDPTVARCECRATAWGYGCVIVVNLFAFRATKPTVMKKVAEPIGADNDAAILRAASEAKLFVCGWGNHGAHLGRDKKVLSMLAANQISLHRLGVTKAEQPGHPLYLPYSLTPQPFTVEQP